MVAHFASILLLAVLFGDAKCEAQSRSNSIGIADGTLRSCYSNSLDNIFAVGDRGLLLSSKNGGKSWTTRSDRSNDTFYRIQFANPQSGIVVGGTIEPATGRSVGSILVTGDAGESWTRIRHDLPRLTGLVHVQNQEWIAWGDWSTLFESSVFRTRDGGRNWQSVIVPCGQMQSIAIYNPSKDLSGVSRRQALPPLALLIDALGRVYSTSDWANYRPVNAPTTPYQSYPICESYDGEWWIGGSEGALYRSSDLVQWQSVSLPGNTMDRDLIGLEHIAFQDNQVWLVGSPGTVVWNSSDRGNQWQVIPTDQNANLYSLHAIQGNVLVACGQGATVLTSRNGGNAWSTLHQSTSRVSALNIASHAERVAWDALTFIQHEIRRSTAGIVLHDQGIERRSSQHPDKAAFTSEASARLGIVDTITWRSMPTSAQSHSPRDSDLNYYRNLGSMHAPPTSKILRRLILAIRSYQPDLILTDCRLTGTVLQEKTAEAVDLATTWSSRREYELFSAESGIPNVPWTTSRVLYRGTRAGGIHFSPSMLLKSSGSILGEVLLPALDVAQPYLIESRNLSTDKIYYRTNGSKNSTLRDPLEALPLLPTSLLVERPIGIGKASSILKSATWFDWRELVPTTNFNPLVRDRSWEERLQLAMRNVDTVNRLPVLLDIAVKNRQAGNWNHWSGALEHLIHEGGPSSYSEAATHELMKFSGSAELFQIVSKQIQSLENRIDASVESGATFASASSPFARTNENSAVQMASYSHAPRRIPIGHQGGLPEFHRLLSKMSNEYPTRRLEGDWGWLIASRYRSLKASKAVSGLAAANADMFWPTECKPLLEWQNVRQQEAQLLHTPTNSSSTAPAIPLAVLTAERPFLDGHRSEPMWSGNPVLELRDPWNEDPGKTKLYIAQDAEFVYLFAEVTNASIPHPKSGATRDRPNASLLDFEEQVRVRIDLDRDYATWFELGWNRSGVKHDSFNDVEGWNPGWYLAVSEVSDGWNAEIAIPKSELLAPEIFQNQEAESLGMHCWAWNAIHQRPGMGTRSVAPAVSDRFQNDQWSLVDMRMAKVADDQEEHFEAAAPSAVSVSSTSR